MKKHQVLVMILFGIIGGQLSYLYHQDFLSIKSAVVGNENNLVVGFLFGVILSAIILFRGQLGKYFRLDDVKFNIPFGSINFAVKKETLSVAWHLFIETTTRIATQPLGDEEGILREALTSLYALFKFTRDKLKELDPIFFEENIKDDETTVEMYAFDMLNNELRPFLAEWHPRLTLYEKKNPDAPESEWEDAQVFRRELEALRKRILPYAKGFGKTAQVPDYEKYFQEEPTAAAG